MVASHSKHTAIATPSAGNPLFNTQGVRHKTCPAARPIRRTRAAVAHELTGGIALKHCSQHTIENAAGRTKLQKTTSSNLPITQVPGPVIVLKLYSAYAQATLM